jgi:DNA-binding NtrC family response regulator
MEIAMAKILTIEDEDNLRLSIRRSLAKAGHDVAEASSIAAGRPLALSGDFDVVLTDVNLGDGSGGDLVRELRADGFEGVILLMTAFGTIESAVRAMKDGADDYLQKPLSLEELALLINRSLENRALRNRVRLYERIEQAREPALGEALGESPEWLKTLATADRLAALPIPGSGGAGGPTTGGAPLPTVLLLGETGAGKGVLARFIHARASQTASTPTPFVHVNCSALPPTLVESELFGHEKGAFTDAKAAREGLFEMAEGGTIFLDEIGDMPPELQTKLLLIVEQGVFRRVGGSKERRVRARVIAATNQDLAARVGEGKFRRDLLYRLNAFVLRIPPLREREGDAMLLAESFLRRAEREFGRDGLRFSDSAARSLRDHDWPGNVRELANAIQRAAMLAQGPEVVPEDLGLGAVRLTPRPAARDAERNLETGDLIFDFEAGTHTAEEVERALIVQALEHCRGNVSRAAKLIGMNRGSLRYRIERYALEGAVQEAAR